MSSWLITREREAKREGGEREGSACWFVVRCRSVRHRIVSVLYLFIIDCGEASSTPSLPRGGEAWKRPTPPPLFVQERQENSENDGGGWTSRTSATGIVCYRQR